MHEIRLVGRGGQGVVTAGELLGRAAVTEGKFAQSIPTFGPERRGALAQCTLRLSNDTIMHKCGSVMPHVVVVIDPTIWYAANVVAGLRDEGVLVFNTARTPEEIAEDLRSGTHGYRITAARFELYTVDATQIAIESLGRPIPNTAAMGALSGATGLISMESIERVFQDRFDGAAAANIEAAHRARSGLRKLGG